MTNARSSKKALVIGGGIAGPVAAMALRKAGLEPVIFEAHGRGADGVGAFLSLAGNGVRALGRAQLLSTTFADYERKIRAHMTRLFASAGFDAKRDIAGIVLNRWGHARQVQPPGWYFGRAGRQPVREVIEHGYGRIVIAHSELNGHQSMTGAMAQGKRGAEQVLAS